MLLVTNRQFKIVKNNVEYKINEVKTKSDNITYEFSIFSKELAIFFQFYDHSIFQDDFKDLITIKGGKLFFKIEIEDELYENAMYSRIIKEIDDKLQTQKYASLLIYLKEEYGILAYFLFALDSNRLTIEEYNKDISKYLAMECLNNEYYDDTFYYIKKIGRYSIEKRYLFNYFKEWLEYYPEDHIFNGNITLKCLKKQLNLKHRVIDLSIAFLGFNFTEDYTNPKVIYKWMSGYYPPIPDYYLYL